MSQTKTQIKLGGAPKRDKDSAHQSTGFHHPRPGAASEKFTINIFSSSTAEPVVDDMVYRRSARIVATIDIIFSTFLLVAYLISLVSGSAHQSTNTSSKVSDDASSLYKNKDAPDLNQSETLTRKQRKKLSLPLKLSHPHYFPSEKPGAFRIPFIARIRAFLLAERHLSWNIFILMLTLLPLHISFVRSILKYWIFFLGETLAVLVWMGLFAVCILQLLVAGGTLGGTYERDGRKTIRNCKIWMVTTCFLVFLLLIQLVTVLVFGSLESHYVGISLLVAEIVFRSTGLIIVSRFIKELNFEFSGDDDVDLDERIFYEKLGPSSNMVETHQL